MFGTSNISGAAVLLQGIMQEAKASRSSMVQSHACRSLVRIPPSQRATIDSILSSSSTAAAKRRFSAPSTCATVRRRTLRSSTTGLLPRRPRCALGASTLSRTLLQWAMRTSVNTIGPSTGST
jgi:hypothetical protein